MMKTTLILIHLPIPLHMDIIMDTLTEKYDKEIAYHFDTD